ncbi:hypothetical protein [Vulcanisaeta thermophila]|uniref:hypothetical protein n=1 Tax=Vulcanisaeta thermophila TaxID=867917 RepID=UPI0008533F5D|nr:hypothetical protein [Vulcanisaeta thermophila]
MNTLAFIITTVALMALVIFYTYYTYYYTAQNLVNTVDYVQSLVTTALRHEITNAISIASMGNVAGTFNYTLIMPTSALSTQGIAINYVVNLYQENNNGVYELMANITVTASIGPITKTTQQTTTLYAAQQPYTITAYNCQNTNQPTTIMSPNQQTQTCTWTTTTFLQGKATISITKPQRKP